LERTIHVRTYGHHQHYNFPRQILIISLIFLAPGYQLLPFTGPDISFCYVPWGKNKTAKKLLPMHLTS